MNRFLIVLTVAAAGVAASAQTASKPSAPAAAAPKSSASTTTAPKSTSAATTASTTSTSTPWIKLPPNVPPRPHGVVKTIPITIHYYDIKVGTGPAGEPGKIWHMKYTGWRAADGVQFDTWSDHKQPVMGKDGKPELGADGKPKTEAQPAPIMQGVGAVIPGFDYGLAGMKVGGIRRIFIPWQLAYGMRAIPERPDHPGIPAKSDLIFDVELVDVTDMPARPMPPAPPAQPHPMPQAPAKPGASAQPNAAPPQPAAPAPSAKPSQPATPASPSAPAQPATAAPQTQPATPQPK